MKFIEFKKLKNFLKGLPRALAEKALLALLALIVFALILGALVFYNYSFLAERKEPILEKEALEFREDLFQRFLGEYQAREKRFQGTGAKAYPDLFRPIELTE